MGSFLELVLYTLATLLPILNPFSTAPLFLAITEGYDEAERKEQARRGVLYMVAILGVFLLAGTLIINAFGISLPGVRIAGGILVGRVAFRMLYPKDRVGLTPEEEKESRNKADISFFPLAMPSLSGPGSIAATISLATIVERWWDYIAISVGILLIAVVVFVSLGIAALCIGGGEATAVALERD